MTSSDYEVSLYNLFFHAYVYEQLRRKYPELMNHICEILYKEFNNSKSKEFINEVKTKGNNAISEFESLLLVNEIPELNEKYDEPFKEVLQLAHEISSPVSHPISNSHPIRIYLEGCWDLMHSGHYNAMRQVFH